MHEKITKKQILIGIYIIACIILFSSICLSGEYPFIEGNIANDVDIAILNEDTGMFVMVYNDDTADDISYQVLWTNGTAYRTETDIDATAGDASRVGVEALNETTFIITYAKDIPLSGDWMIHIRDIDDVEYFNTTVDADIDDNIDASVCAVNSTRYMSAVIDDADGDATFVVYNWDTEIKAQTDLDTDVSPGAVDMNLIDCAAINETEFAVSWFDDAGTDTIKYSTVDDAGNILKSDIAVDTSATDADIGVAGIGNDRFVVFYCDETDADVSFSTYGSDPSNVSQQDVNDSIAHCSGDSGTKVTVSSLGTEDSQFVVAWDNGQTEEAWYAVYNYSGAEILAPTKIGDSNADYKSIAVIGYNDIRDVSVCEHETDSEPIIVAYNNGSDAIWLTKYANGSDWDGICEAPVGVADVNITTNATTATTEVNLNASYLVTITNNGTGSNTYNITYSNTDSADTIGVNQTNITLAESASGDIVFMITDADPGTYKANVTAIDSDDATLNATTAVITTTVQDTENPIVMLNSPANNTWNTSLSINVTANATDNVGFANCSVYTNETAWSLKQTNTSPIANNTVFTINNTFAADGVYLWNVYCCDTSGNCAFNATNYTIEIDTTAPSPSFVYPTNGTTYNDYNGSIIIDLNEEGNCTINDTRWDYQSDDLSRYSFINNTNITADGEYEVNVSCWDSRDNNASEILYFKINTIDPVRTAITPATSPYYTSQNLDYKSNWTDTDLYRGNVTLYNSTNRVVDYKFYDLINTTNLTIEHTFVFSHGNQNYTIEDCATDDHTDGEELKKGKKGESILLFNSTDDTQRSEVSLIFIEKDDKLTDVPGDLVTTFASGDEWDINFTVVKPETKIIFNITTNNIPIVDRSYKGLDGHLLWGDYFHDFSVSKTFLVNGEERTATVNVTKINDYNYQVKWIPDVLLEGGDVIFIDPLSGGTNTKCENTTIVFDTSAPTFSSPSNTSINFKINYNFTANITITNVDLDYYIFSTNVSGSWANTSTDISGTEYHAKEEVNITRPVNSNICWYYWGNDTAGNSGSSSTYCFFVNNTVPTNPIIIYPLNNSNHSLNNLNLSLNISSSDVDADTITYFHFINGTINSSTTSNTSINLSDGSYYYTVLASDGTENSSNSTNVYFSLDSSAPTFSNPSNTSINFKINSNFTANITIEDHLDIDYYIFSTNVSGSWANTSADISGTKYNATNEINITKPVDSNICWYYWANDTLGNSGSSTTYCFSVNNTVPTHTIPILNATDNPLNRTTANLTCYNQSTADVDDNEVKNIYNWHKNNVSIMVLNMPFESWAGNSTQNNNNWTKDYSGFGNDGIVINATWNSTGGYDGKGAYEFDGINDYIDCSNDTSLTIVDNLTVSAWVKPNTLAPSDTMWIWNKEQMFELGINASGNFTYAIKNTDPGWTYIVTNVSASLDWQHMVFTYANGEIKIYMNGSERYSYSGSGSIVSSTLPFWIGYRHSGFEKSFNGTIDEVQIYNYSLSAAQIKALYENKTNLIVSQETSKGENWTCEITPNDGTGDGTALNSSILTILNTPPTTPTINYPLNNSNISSVNITLNVSLSDADNDQITFYHYINSTLNSTSTGLNGTFNASDGVYEYYVFAGDGEENTSNSTTVYFTLDTTDPTVAITAPTGSIDAGTATLSYTITDANILNCAYYIIRADGIVTVSNTSLTCTAASTTFSIPADNTYTVYVWGNDSTGHMGSASSAFSINPITDSGTGSGSGKTRELKYITDILMEKADPIWNAGYNIANFTFFDKDNETITPDNIKFNFTTDLIKNTALVKVLAGKYKAEFHINKKLEDGLYNLTVFTEKNKENYSESFELRLGEEKVIEKIIGISKREKDWIEFVIIGGVLFLLAIIITILALTRAKKKGDQKIDKSPTLK